jgi:hypothetical protein
MGNGTLLYDQAIYELAEGVRNECRILQGGSEKGILWVEPIPGFVGFGCTQPNLHFAGVIAKCETQHRPISEPSPKSFYFDLAGRFFGRRLV